jgi:hypothetical protein
MSCGGAGAASGGSQTAAATTRQRAVEELADRIEAEAAMVPAQVGTLSWGEATEGATAPDSETKQEETCGKRSA